VEKNAIAGTDVAAESNRLSQRSESVKDSSKSQIEVPGQGGNPGGPHQRLEGEFVALMAMMISMAALSIDGMLPALPEIGKALGVIRENDNQLIVSTLFLGMATGQLVYGPVSDKTGRKPAIYYGLCFYMVGCLLSIFAGNFQVMLVGRFLQGLGVASPRIVTMALVRDQFSGRVMARVMSFIMTVFILVPVIAPLVGQLILIFADWRGIFCVYLVHALIVAVWFTLRQPETLPRSLRRPISPGRIFRALREIIGNRKAFGFTIVIGLIAGAFIGYLNSAQQIFQELYGLGRLFPIYFSTLAVAIGGASFVNGRLVVRLGMRRLTWMALICFCTNSLVFGAVAWAYKGQPPLILLMPFFLVSFFSIGILFGNLNALAMETLGHIAGIGASVVGSLSTFMAMLLGTMIGQNYNCTILPLVVGFFILSAVAMVVVRWADS